LTTNLSFMALVAREVMRRRVRREDVR